MRFDGRRPLWVKKRPQRALNNLRERQADGIAKAKRAGRYQGGVKRIDRTRVRAVNSKGSGPSAIASEMGISRRQVYRILGEDL